MERSEWNLSHTMPAFVGNALQEQSDWRIPSFKGVLRQWWRVVVCGEDPSITVDQLGKREGELFGQVLDSDYANKSNVVLAFSGQPAGPTGETWPGNMGKVGKQSVDAELYLGYGPIQRKGKRVEPTYKRWIEPGANAQLLVKCGDADYHQLIQAFSALHHFGGIGNRSRRGWGSLCLVDDNNNPPGDLSALLDTSTIDLETALSKDWVSGFVRDDSGLLIWESQGTLKQWKACVSELAKQLKAVNATMRSYEGKGPKHTLVTLGGIQPRWSSLLRFKVIKKGDGLALRLVFLPCQVPANRKLQSIERHHCDKLASYLDGLPGYQRLQFGGAL